MSSTNHHVYHRHATAGASEEERPIMAERYKTKLCKNYVATGACRYDVRCMFAHGEQELRTPEQNVQDGLVTEEAIKSMQHQMLLQQRDEARFGHDAFAGPRMVGEAPAMLPPPPPFHAEMPTFEAPRMIHNPYLLDLLPREAHIYTYPAGYSDAMSVSSRSSYDYFPEAGSQCSGRVSPMPQMLNTQCQKNLSWGDFDDSVRDLQGEGRVMEP